MDLIVLWTISGGMGTAADIKMLKAAGGFNISVVAADRYDRESVGFALTGGRYIVPEGDNPHYIESLMDICSRCGITTIIPQYGDELVPLSKSRAAFEQKGIKVLVSEDPYKLCIANSKKELYEFFNGCSFIPCYTYASGIDGVERAIYSLGYPRVPVCIKPVHGEGGRGVRIVTDECVDIFSEQANSIKTSWDILKNQMEKIKSLPELIVMEYLPGKEYSVDCVCKDGNTLVSIPRQRMETVSGVATVTAIEKNDELMELSRYLISRLDLSYNVNIQFKYSADGRPRLVEINPRVSGSLVANLGAGVNMLELSLRMAYGMPAGDVDVGWGTRMIRYWDQLFVK